MKEKDDKKCHKQSYETYIYIMWPQTVCKVNISLYYFTYKTSSFIIKVVIDKDYHFQ